MSVTVQASISPELTVRSVGVNEGPSAFVAFVQQVIPLFRALSLSDERSLS